MEEERRPAPDVGGVARGGGRGGLLTETELGKVRRSTGDNWRNGIFIQVRPVSSDGEKMKAAR